MSQAGWYPDPWRQASWRWWDGAVWTGFTEHWFIPPPEVAPAHFRVRAGGIAALGALVGIALAVVVSVVFAIAGADLQSPWVLLLSTLGLWSGLAGSSLVASRRKGTGSLATDFGLEKPRGVDIPLGIGLGIGVVILVGVVTAIIVGLLPDIQPRGRDDIVDPLTGHGTFGTLVIIFIAVVGAPFVEELYFRGLLMGTLVARWGLAIGLIGQALVFGVAHVTPDGGLGNLGVFIIIATVGTALGAIRLMGRLVPCMITHATYNAIIIGIALAIR